MKMMRVTTEAFGASVAAAMQSSGKVADMLSHDVDYTGAVFLTADALSGFAVQADGELVSVFSTVKGRGAELLSAAIEAGADHLDCFDGFLPTLYARHGFRETARAANWTPGGPDVVWMKR